MDTKKQIVNGVSNYSSGLNPQNTVNEPYEVFNLTVDDDRLVKMLVNSLDQDISHWEQAPWLLTTTDVENINYLMGDQLDEKYLLPHQTRYVDNRLHASVRAILAYATGQLAKPQLLPSKTDDNSKRTAKNMEVAIYQHALDHDVNTEMRVAVKNVVARKRGCLKLRFDENAGAYGDILTENIDPADIVIDRFATFGQDPRKIYHRQKCTIEELVAKFPDKQQEIFQTFTIKRGTYSQMSRMVTYWECWFTYWDDQNKEKEGVCWFLPNTRFILGKMENPNWLYNGSEKSQKIANLTTKPMKPFVWLNYLNSGRPFIDETCLLDQAIPLQDVLNKRGRQIVENADYAVPRVLIDKRVMEESDAKKFVNKHPKTIGMVDTSQVANEIQKSVLVIPAQQLPAFVFQDKLDARSEIDTMMGTPVQFRGEQPQSKNPTLGQDLLVKQQAGALQDDLVGVINNAYRDYYTKLLQMMRVYLSDDYWVMSKGADGEYAAIVLSSDNIDTNVRVGVQVDSSLPIDKQSQRAIALQLAQMPGRLDDLSLYEMLGLPDPEKLAERVQRFNIDRYTYMESIEQKLYDAEAETDITLITAGKVPEERDDYSERYLGYWNLFIASNRFAKLKPDQQQKLTNFLHWVANKAAITEGLKDSMLNPAGIIDRAPLPPMPKRDIRITGQLSPEDSQQMAGLPPQQAVGGQAAAPPQGAPAAQPANAAAGAAGGSPPRIQQPPNSLGM